MEHDQNRSSSLVLKEKNKTEVSEKKKFIMIKPTFV